MTKPVDPAAQGWHLDRRVPIALIFTLLMQMAAGIWFAATMAGEVAGNAKAIGDLKNDDLADLKNELRTVKQDRDDIKSRVIRIEEKISSQTDVLRRIENAVTTK